LRYSLAFILVSLEPDSHPRKRSDELTNGYKWQVFLALAAFGLYTLLAVIPMALFGAISLVSESVSTLLIELYESLLYPLNVVIMVSIYYSLLFKHGKLQVVPIHQEAGQADYIPPPYKPVYTEQATLIGETMPGGDIEPLSDTTPVAESEPGTPNVSASEEAPPR
jgi:hypothetical protein